MSTPVLQYGGRITQLGVVCTTTPDGLRILVPGTAWVDRLDLRLPVVGRAIWIALETLMFIVPVAWGGLGRLGSLVRAWTGKPVVEVELTASELVITDRRGDITCQRLPRGAIGEFRLNRFQPTIWVRIPGRDAQDALSGLDRQIQQYIVDRVAPLLPGCGGEDSTPAAPPPDNRSV